MGRALGLCALALLSLQNTLSISTFQSGEVLIFCDDPTVDKAVTSAINKFNEGMHTGHKLALFQVMSASKVRTSPWRLHKKQNKKTFIHMNETDTDTEHVECQIGETDLAQCLGCPEEIDQNSEDLKVPLSVSISKYNSQSDHTHLFTLNDVGPATRQVVAGFRFKFKFDMRRTKCAKEEHKDLQEHCTADPDNVELANCNSTVDMAPWRQELPNVQLDRDLRLLVSFQILRRRPPGWSPLRNILIQFPTASPKAPPPSDAPPKTKEAKISGKEESSEEDLAKPSASPEDSLFHCPSKPWKPFHPHARSSAAEATPTNAPVEGAFSDTDLLEWSLVSG
uniref:Cystatin kininogen-type domain-containing protein n=1 Tax=Periophthalmus magnuspinnatus TaxID=409849 RepID=A0A3B4BLV7_9GOBI